MITSFYMWLIEPELLGKLNHIVIELSPNFELNQNRIESMAPFPATRAFSILVLKYAIMSKCWTVVLAKI